MINESVMIRASAQTCNNCNKQAVAFWPTDRISTCKSWCRECLDDAKNKDLENDN